MPDRPDIKPGQWIRVGRRDCVVARVRESGHVFGDCEVIFDESKPTNSDIEWDGNEWKFAERGSDYGGYADRYSRLDEYVRILKRGRWA